jgi:hypothetical protein
MTPTCLNVPAVLESFALRQQKVKEYSKSVCLLTFTVEPFLPAVAKQWEVDEHLFTASGVPLSDITQVKVSLIVPELELTLAYSQDIDPFLRVLAKLGPTLTCTLTNKTYFVARFTLEVDPPGGSDLARLVVAFREPLFLSLHEVQGSLLGQLADHMDQKEEEEDVYS